MLSHPDIKINNTTEYYIGGQCTALMIACHMGNSAIVSRLVQVPGLDINYQDETNRTALNLACRGGHTEIVSILAETDRVDWNKRYNNGPSCLSCSSPLCQSLPVFSHTQYDL